MRGNMKKYECMLKCQLLNSLNSPDLTEDERRSIDAALEVRFYPDCCSDCISENCCVLVLLCYLAYRCSDPLAFISMAKRHISDYVDQIEPSSTEVG